MLTVQCICCCTIPASVEGLLYTQSTRISVPLSRLGPPAPSPASECVPPPHLGPRGVAVGLILEMWRASLEKCRFTMETWRISVIAVEANSGSEEAYPGAVEAQSEVVEAHLLESWSHPGPGAVEAHHGTVQVLHEGMESVPQSGWLILNP
jgi:hypothetical protein